MKLIIAFAVLLIAANSKANQTYPGTASRPVLSEDEAAGYTKAAYLQGWAPRYIVTPSADYTVTLEGFSSIQAAVNAAISTKSTTRKYIRINGGTYKQVVYIPETSVPLTIYGVGDVIISFDLSANLTGTEYRAKLGNFSALDDPGYVSCANSRGTIGTTCSSVVWVRAPNVELINLTIQNNGTAQAVALNVDADKVQIRYSLLVGHQHTLYVGSQISKTLRNYFVDVYVEGDADFVIGTASVVFEKCFFYVTATRRNDSAVVFAPGTDAKKKYGFLLVESFIFGDSTWFKSQRVSLARAWDIDGANGQMVIRDSQLDAIFDPDAPYTKSTSGRPYAGNANTNRKLTDNKFNKFWEFDNAYNVSASEA